MKFHEDLSLWVAMFHVGGQVDRWTATPNQYFLNYFVNTSKYWACP
jgi:hypothetical protein